MLWQNLSKLIKRLKKLTLWLGPSPTNSADCPAMSFVFVSWHIFIKNTKISWVGQSTTSNWAILVVCQIVNKKSKPPKISIASKWLIAKKCWTSKKFNCLQLINQRSAAEDNEYLVGSLVKPHHSGCTSCTNWTETFNVTSVIFLQQLKIWRSTREDNTVVELAPACMGIHGDTCIVQSYHIELKYVVFFLAALVIHVICVFVVALTLACTTLDCNIHQSRSQ